VTPADDQRDEVWEIRDGVITVTHPILDDEQ
jgi:hypothetical protein